MPNQPTALTDLAVADNKIRRLLAQKKITVKDVENLTKLEHQYLGELATHTLNRLTGKERDDYLDKIDLIMNADTKNSLWEHNHTVITAAIANLMRQYGTMPTKSNIAEATGLTRQTIARHIKQYQAHPGFAEEMDRFKLLSQDVLAKVFKYASNGDMRAARLYFEMVGAISKRPAGAVVNQQHNYIQINNTILSQENLDRLSAEQLAQIEQIVRG
ncbi:hypothetical protein HQ865_10825 [Mucilaginibacter mali]|uniref:Uncharacterized protein n=1 Tax=Mucilaginibacter mali TaxID=2740462 RepID=A0A7D4UFC7_9SPHI|nr:hypothetical protein [Mucilaginibacter mali]QKJ30236.1 hypothetical protein HQ865_10825 [Mucilaginibacter mali]